jgi:hypothetical protein
MNWVERAFIQACMEEREPCELHPCARSDAEGEFFRNL